MELRNRGKHGLLPWRHLSRPRMCVRAPRITPTTGQGGEGPKQVTPPRPTLNFCPQCPESSWTASNSAKLERPRAGPRPTLPPFPSSWHRTWHTTGAQQEFASLHGTKLQTQNPSTEGTQGMSASSEVLAEVSSVSFCLPGIVKPGFEYTAPAKPTLLSSWRRKEN